MKTTIKNEDAEGSTKCLSVMVVTVGDLSNKEVRHALKPGESVTVDVAAGQFVMVDEKED
ncbi:hypothetical protein ACG04Q_11835 [Roseateles sp. DXS20W]|uniref:Uncharacterized protein n=1 Tax=Pelomonas lactea TaxID=3299030 RepID=A0ABW7GJX5_9BURK